MSSDQEKILKDIIPDIKKYISLNCVITENLEFLKTRRGLQTFFDIKYSDCLKQKVYENLLSYAVEAEKKCPDSGMTFLRLLCSLDSQSPPPRRSFKSIEKLIDDKNLNKKIRSIAKFVARHASLTTTIAVKKSSNLKTYVDINPGYTFSVSSLLKSSGAVELSKPRVICIDGYVESVSEIHHILTYLSENSLQCLIFSRGMSEDVLHTLKVNMDRGTLNVYPFKVPFDIEHANTIVDIAVVAGTDVVSSLKGNLISSIDVNSMGYFESSEILGDKIKIKKRDTDRRVYFHVKNLRENIKARPELEDILSKRIKSLSSNCIDIALPDDIDYYSHSMQLDETIRSVTAIFNKMYDPDTIAKKYLKDFYDMFRNTVYTIVEG